MIFLYKFEYTAADGSLSYNGSYNRTAQNTRWLLTNYESGLTLYENGSDVWSPWQQLLLQSADTGLPTQHIFTPVAGISHSNLRLDGQKSAGQVNFTLPIDHALAKLFVADYPGGDLWVTVYSMDTPDTVPLSIYTGRVQTCEFAAPIATLKSIHLAEVLRRPGLTKKWSRTCGHALYDGESCRVRRNAFVDTAEGPDLYFLYREDGYATTVGADGLTLTVPEAANRPDGFFEHGYIVIEPVYGVAGDSPALPRHLPRADWAGNRSAIQSETGNNGVMSDGVRRSIAAHTGSLLTLATPLVTAIPPGARVTLFAGCDKSRDTCQTKFKNVVFFGGYDRIPPKNPFESGLA